LTSRRRDRSSPFLHKTLTNSG